jgi:hypothetical protein
MNNAIIAARLWASYEELPMSRPRPARPCAVCEQTRPHHAHGLCLACYTRRYRLQRSRRRQRASGRIVTCVTCGQLRSHAARGRCKHCYDRVFRPLCYDCGSRANVKAHYCPRCTERRRYSARPTGAPPPQGRCPGVPGIRCDRGVALTRPPFVVYCLRCGQLRQAVAA